MICESTREYSQQGDWRKERKVVEEKSFGSHRMLFEEGGLVTAEVRGDLCEADVKAMMIEHDARLLEYGTLFLLCDVREFSHLGPGARQALMQRQTEIPHYYIAIVSHNFVARVVPEMLYRAVKILGMLQITVHHFTNPLDARTWLLEQQSAWKAMKTSECTERTSR